MWEIKKLISKGDYIYALVPNHPKATKNGYVLHHRIVVENCLGRLLNDDKVVHHKDGNKRNNSIENLEVMTNSKHVRYHKLKEGRTYAKIKCPACGKIFVQLKRNSVDKRQYNCSRHCGRMFQLMSTKERNDNIKNCIIEIFKA